MSQRRNIPRITGGAWKGRPLAGGVPKGTRPTSSKIREALGSRLNNSFSGAHVLDVFAGAGALSIEALSRGAARALALEKNPKALSCIRKSVQDFEARDRFESRCVDALNFLRRGRPSPMSYFDIVFVDPPYASKLAAKTLTALISGDWLSSNAQIVVESSARDDTITPPPGLAILNSRRYGDTLISLYCKTPLEGECT